MRSESWPRCRARLDPSWASARPPGAMIPPARLRILECQLGVREGPWGSSSDPSRATACWRRGYAVGIMAPLPGSSRSLVGFCSPSRCHDSARAPSNSRMSARRSRGTVAIVIRPFAGVFGGILRGRLGAGEGAMRSESWPRCRARLDPSWASARPPGAMIPPARLRILECQLGIREGPIGDLGPSSRQLRAECCRACAAGCPAACSSACRTSRSTPCGSRWAE